VLTTCVQALILCIIEKDAHMKSCQDCVRGSQCPRVEIHGVLSALQFVNFDKDGSNEGFVIVPNQEN